MCKLANHLSYYLPDILLTVIYRLVKSSVSHRPLINLYSRWYLNLQCFCILVGCSSCLVLLVMMEWYFEKILHVIYILNEMDFLHRNAQVSHGMNITDSNFNLYLMAFSNSMHGNCQLDSFYILNVTNPWSYHLVTWLTIYRLI